MLKKEDKWEKKFNYKILKLIKKNIFFYDNKKKFSSKLEDIKKNGKIDFIFAVGWRFIISKNIYSQSKIGSFVFHDSLLPKNRGFAP